jgi:hypothetical protein
MLRGEHARILWMSAGRRTPRESVVRNRLCPRANAGLEGTPVFTVVTNDELTPAGATAAVEGRPRSAVADRRDRSRWCSADARCPLEAEVAACIAAHADQLDEHGRRLLTREAP